MKYSLFSLLILCSGVLRLEALINPNFTPVHLIEQSIDIWEAMVTLDEDALTLRAVTTEALKGEARAEEALLDFSESEFILFDLEEGFVNNQAKGIFITGDFSGASMGGGEIGEKPWAMLKVGTKWLMIARDEEESFVVREDPIDLSTVWAGDAVNFRQVIEFVLTDPRAAVPVATGGRWASEENLFELEGAVHGMDRVRLGERTLVVVYRSEGDVLLDPANGFKDVTEEKGLASASVHAAWGRFLPGAHPSLASLTAEGELIFHRRNEGRFEALPTGQHFETVTGLASVAGPEKAMLLIGTSEGMVLGDFEEGAWTERMSASLPPEAGPGGPVLGLDMNHDGSPALLQAGRDGLRVLIPDWKSLSVRLPVSADPTDVFVPYNSIGTPLSLTPGDFNGNGYPDLLIGGDRGAAFVVNEGGHTFRETLISTGELSYNIRPGVHMAAVGDHALDGRQGLVLFNRSLPPQVYFNRGFAVFGYDMELDLIEGAPDAQEAAGGGQQAALLADLTGNGLQELMFVNREGQLWLLTRSEEATPPLGATLNAPPGLTGPVPVVVRDGQRILGAHLLSPHAPAHIGRRNRGPVTLSWHLPGETSPREQRVIVLRNESHTLSVD